MNISESLRKNLILVAVCLGIVTAGVAFNNITTPDEPINAGFTEVETECMGVDTVVCLGLKIQDQTVYNYDDYETPEPGTENYVRKIEAELIGQAYNICEDPEITEMEWTSEASFDNKTGEEWLEENENVTLLPCEQTFHLTLDEGR